MGGIVKDEWIINNKNVFGLASNAEEPIFKIQVDVLHQLKDSEINSLTNYLGSEITITKPHRAFKQQTIQSLLRESLKFDESVLRNPKLRCSVVLDYLKMLLYDEYCNNTHKNILSFTIYQSQYKSLLQSYLLSNIDTDEQDFINVELLLCESLVSELSKPIYSGFNAFSEVLDTPSNFKKDLTNSINKRRELLNSKQTEVSNLKTSNSTKQEAKRNTDLSYLQKMTDKIVETGFRINLKKTDEIIGRIEKELQQAKTNEEKKKICLRHIANTKQIRVTQPFVETEEMTGETRSLLPYRRMDVKIVEWAELELEYLESISKNEPQQIKKKKAELNEVLSEQITHVKKVEIAKAIKDKYSSYKGKEFKILYEALLKLDLFPPKNKRSTFFRCLQNEGYNINSIQMLEDQYFTQKSKVVNGKSVQTEDEKHRDTIIEYLKTIINPK